MNALLRHDVALMREIAAFAEKVSSSGYNPTPFQIGEWCALSAAIGAAAERIESGFTDPTTGRKTADAPADWPFGTAHQPRRSKFDIASDVGPATF